MTNLIKLFLFFFISISLLNCGGFKKVDSRKVPVNAQERARKNIKEGRGTSIGTLMNKGGTNYEFSTSNPMWRATLDILDFLPLSTVDYSGGIIISDWYTDETNKNQALKITVRFMSNVIQSNSLKITVHRKKCSVNQSCNVELFKSRIQEEIIASILKEAAILEKQVKK